MAIVKAPNIDFTRTDPLNNMAQPVDPVGGFVVLPAEHPTPVAAPKVVTSGSGDATWSYPIGG